MKPPPPRSRDRRAFLLLEVVLALSIFVVVVVGLIASLNAGLDADREQRRFSMMRQNLESLYDEALADLPGPGEEFFNEETTGVTYRRKVESVTVTLDNGKRLNGISKLTVTAFDNTTNNNVMSELWTYVDS